jgi:tripartite-type tricarboxylate transporter receptor subunit TctC
MRAWAVLAILLSSAISALLFPSSAAAQIYPTKPPRLLVGFVPGGGVDQTARIAAAKLSDIWGQQITVENRPGAGGTIAADAAAKSPGDGYTFVLCNVGSHGIGPALYRKLGYDALKDVTYIGLIGTTPNVFVVHPSVPANTVAEFIAYAKANPGKLSYGSSGIGTSTHLGVELFRSMTGIQVTHVPYKGGAQSSADLLGGQIQFLITNLPEQVAYIKAGRTRALGVSTAKRSPQFPDVPAIGEALPGYEVTVWYGLCGPAGIPRPLLERISADLMKAVSSPEVVKRYADAGVEAAPTTPEQFTEFARAEIAKWAKVVKDSGASAD